MNAWVDYAVPSSAPEGLRRLSAEFQPRVTRRAGFSVVDESSDPIETPGRQRCGRFRGRLTESPLRYRCSGHALNSHHPIAVANPATGGPS